jgi:peptidoglycan pentaglycine glycine transferase (the first glycine)
LTDLRPLTPDPAAWDAFVAAHPHAHVLQLPAWGTLKARFGWEAETVALAGPDGAPVAGALILYRALPFGLGRMAYVPKGPLAPSHWWAAPERMRPLWDALHAAARRHGACWIKVEAPDDPDQTQLSAALSAAGFRPSPQNIQPPRTVTLDLGGSEDDILARMKQKTRYNIRLSAKKDVSVREGSAVDVDSFNAMLHVTGERDAFGVHDPAYYRAAYDLFVPSGRAALLIASYHGQDLAGIMIFAVGKTAWYLYGASTNAERNRMPTYALQWAAIQWARARGCTIYDLWGVPDADEDALEAGFESRHDGLWGVYRAKRGYGGQVVRRMPAWDHIYSPPIYRLYQLYLRARGRGGDGS